MFFFIFKTLFLTSAHQNYLKIYKKIILSKNNSKDFFITKTNTFSEEVLQDFFLVSKFKMRIIITCEAKPLS